MNAAATEVEDVVEPEAPVEYEKGSWQDTLDKSAKLADRSAKGKKRAGEMLWTGAKNAIDDWFPNSKKDVNAEGLAEAVMEVLGKSRKGDVSKIRTVAVAVRAHGLDTDTYPNLSKAYAAARALTVLKDQHDEEDNAAEKAIESIEAPSSTTTVDGAAAILLSKGVDGAVVAILDALNGPSKANNEAAHRAFLRAVATEVSARATAVKVAEQNKAKREAEAKKATAAKAAAEKKEAAKTTAAKKTAAKKTAAPAKAKGKPAAARTKAVVEDTVEDDLTGAEADLGVTEIDDDLDGTTEEAAAPAPSTGRKAKPVRRPRR